MSYIEREAVLDRLAKVNMDTYYGFTAAVQFGVDHAIQCIKEAPAADVVEVRHGRWLKRSDGTPYCSNCGANERDTYSSVVNECAFCYSCGARMDKEAEYEAD